MSFCRPGLRGDAGFSIYHYWPPLVVVRAAMKHMNLAAGELM